MLDKLEGPIRTALERSGLPRDAISTVEIVGGGMRPRCVKRRVAEILGLPGSDDHTVGYGLSTTMNMDEAVAKGAAFRCATLSPLFQVKEVQSTDYVVFPVNVSWDIKASAPVSSPDAMDDGEAPESEGKATSDNTLIVFQAGSAYPSAKTITLKSTEPFHVTAAYDPSAFDRGLPVGARAVLGSYRIDGIPEDLATAGRADATKVPRIK